MKKQLCKSVLVVLLVLIFNGSVLAQKNLCDIADVGVLAPNELKAKTSLLHIWQGAKDGIRTNNADRITGLYDFDLYYLFSAELTENHDGDYLLFVASTQAAFGKGINDSKAGSFFELNENAKGDISFIIDKLFLEFTSLDRLFTFDAGKIDLEDFFDGSAIAGCEKSQFLARPLFKNPAIPFPGKGLGVRISYQPGDCWYVQAAVADAQADKRETGFRTTFHEEDYLFSIAELGIKPDFLDMPGTYRFIMWYDPQDKSYLDGSSHTKRDDLGMAVSFDQEIADKTTAFFRYGWADDHINVVEDFISFGAQIEGLLEGRDKDVFAIGCALGVRSPNGLTNADERQIDMVEMYYNIAVKDNVEVTPIIQFVMDPDGKKSQSPATVFGVRCRVKF
jgi:carbohydrate-selective porin OprB